MKNKKTIETLETEFTRLQRTMQANEKAKWEKHRADALAKLRKSSVARICDELGYCRQYLYSVSAGIKGHPMSNKLAKRILKL